MQSSNNFRERIAFRIDKAFVPEITTEVYETLKGNYHIGEVLTWVLASERTTMWLLKAKNRISLIPRPILQRGELPAKFKELKIDKALHYIDNRRID